MPAFAGMIVGAGMAERHRPGVIKIFWRRFFVKKRPLT
jgi:hypothetical protein